MALGTSFTNSPLRSGEIYGGSTDPRELYLKLYAGEVMRWFHRTNTFLDLHRVRTISNGKSASFPYTGTVQAGYHIPGEYIYGQTAVQAEKIITVDQLLIAPIFIPNIDEAMVHYDARSIYSEEAGRALSKKFDFNVARNIVRSAYMTTPRMAVSNYRSVSENAGIGSKLTDLADVETNTASLKIQLRKAAVALDERFIPSEGRYAVLQPAQYYLLAADVPATSILNRDLGNGGSQATPALPPWMGFEFRASNTLKEIAGVNLSAAPADDKDSAAALAVVSPNDYTGNFTNLVATCFQRDAVATVKLMDLAVESKYLVERQGWLLVARYAFGHGTLREECVVNIEKA